ncbi:NAD(P)/FAD-dependent oxidoreductase [Martelella soudanensis]|uniref:NAD(P)/FAD-dependent oxidoreductase n=1 Tax=unclassified Martelella TaxID=2629616 RepID=UPI0015DF2759|nr:MULTISPECIES: FAD-dependent oxidoreductase [unclassified Martelella]
MGPAILPLFEPPALPDAAETVVIGGGIIGVSAALELAEKGHPVTLVEKGQIAAEQSSRNWGWCRQGRRDPRELHLIRESLAMWRGMAARIGADVGFATCGTFFAARDEALTEKYEAWVKTAAEAGIAASMIGPAEIARRLHGDTAPPPRALLCPSDGRAEPQWAVPRMAMAARRMGATIVTDCAARGIETAAGRVTGVVTEQGTIRCNAVIVAGGAWTRRILVDLDIRLPQLAVRSSVSRTQAMTSNGLDVNFWDGVLGVRRRSDGGLTIANALSNSAPITPAHFRYMLDYIPLLEMEWRHIALRFGRDFFEALQCDRHVPYDRPSPYEACRTLDPAPDMRFIRAAHAELKRRFPAFGEAKVVQAWAGMIDAMPDTVPVISDVPAVDGLVVATGFSGHGFGIGPAAGKLAAQLATGEQAFVDPHPFRLSRFTDGSRPRPYTGV